MPDQQAAIITKPSEGSFNNPTFAISSEFSSILHFRPFTVSAMWNYQINFEPFKPFSKWLRLIVERVIGGSLRRQAGLTFVLLFKMAGLIALVFLLLRGGLVEVLPFTLGVSSLMAGSLLGSFVHVLTAPAVESER